jgi:hypothetical protein
VPPAGTLRMTAGRCCSLETGSVGMDCTGPRFEAGRSPRIAAGTVAAGNWCSRTVDLGTHRQAQLLNKGLTEPNMPCQFDPPPIPIQEITS